MVAAGESLKQGGHVYFLSTGSIAVLTTIDASGTNNSPVDGVVCGLC
jgi:hypothetical protein